MSRFISRRHYSSSASSQAVRRGEPLVQANDHLQAVLMKGLALLLILSLWGWAADGQAEGGQTESTNTSGAQLEQGSSAEDSGQIRPN